MANAARLNGAGAARHDRCAMTRENIVLAVASRWVTPLAALFALMQLAAWPAGAGVGFVAGLAMALPIALNALLFGVQPTLAALPATTMRALLALGVIAGFAGVGLANASWSAQLIEAGAFGATASGASLVLLALMGRAGALRDAAW